MTVRSPLYTFSARSKSQHFSLYNWQWCHFGWCPVLASRFISKGWINSALHSKLLHAQLVNKQNVLLQHQINWCPLLSTVVFLLHQQHYFFGRRQRREVWKCARCIVRSCLMCVWVTSREFNVNSIVSSSYNWYMNLWSTQHTLSSSCHWASGVSFYVRISAFHFVIDTVSRSTCGWSESWL